MYKIFVVIASLTLWIFVAARPASPEIDWTVTDRVLKVESTASDELLLNIDFDDGSYAISSRVEPGGVMTMAFEEAVRQAGARHRMPADYEPHVVSIEIYNAEKQEVTQVFERF